MTHETIGSSQKSVGDLVQPDGAVTFRMPYGLSSYDVTLQDKDLNVLLRNGSQKIINNSWLGALDYRTKLGSADLPIFLGTKSIETEPHESGFHAVRMGMLVVTMSMVNEHRGTLISKRDTSTGHWSYVDYIQHPPLEEPINYDQTTG